MRTSSFRQASAAIIAAASILTLAAGPAWSVVRDTDPVKIAVPMGKADFGSGPHVLGAPSGSGLLSFDDQLSTVSVKLTGTVYWDDVFSGGYARVRMLVYAKSGSLLKSVYSSSVGRAGGMRYPGDVPALNVTLVAAHPSTHKVVVTTQQSASAGGPFTNVGSVTRNYGVVNGVD